MSALFVCKCLNVMLESDKYEDIIDIGKLELTPTEQRDIFFSEKLVSCAPSALKEQITQKALAGQRTIGRWVLNSCFSCSQTTHAVLQDRPNTVLICKSNLSSQDRVNSLKKSKNFSPVFNLLVPEVTNDFDMKENVDKSNLIVSERMCPSQQLLSTLRTQMQKTLQSEQMAVEELVSQFKNQKLAELEAYTEKAHRDHKILTSIVNKARRDSDSDNWRMDSGLDNGPPSPQLPPLQRRRLSSIKDAKKINQVSKPIREIPPEEDSLDAEDIFDWEGMDSQNNMISDNEEYDSDPEGDSLDEGIQMPRRGECAELARSLPVSVPGLPQPRPARRPIRDDEEPAQDIAASIKALARSVTGDQFELPRPRFSTQI